MLPLGMGNVVTLDAQWCSLQAEPLPQFLQRLRPHGDIGRTSELVALQCLHRILVHCFS